MRESNYPLRLSKKEKELLKKTAKQSGHNFKDYIKYRIFNCNPDISEEQIFYESPAKDKHNYLTIRMLQDIYMLLLHQITESKTTEETMEIKKQCRDHADKNIAKWGYLKVVNDE